MLLPAFLLYVASIPLPVWGFVGGWLGLKSLLSTGLKCWLDGRAAVALQRTKNEGEKALARLKHASEEQQLRLQHQHEAKERQKERLHEKALALLTARAQQGKGMALAA
jgi:hypothetical protein